MDVVNKTVLLTGATGGIGQEMASQLASKGATLILVGRDILSLQSLADRLYGDGHQCWSADFLNDEKFRLFLEKANQYAAQHGIDIVINNAGCQSLNMLKDQSELDIERQVRLNISVPVRFCQEILHWAVQPAMIVNIGSVLGAIGMSGYSVYCATKAALYRFSESLQRELNDQALQVLYVGPRATNTPLNDHRARVLQQRLRQKVDEPSWVASQVIRSITRETPVKWLGWPERLLVLLNQLCPQMVGRALAKQLPLVRHYLMDQESEV
ncbi:MAG: 3-oxoacyl-[acyl-carrier-protein] reductase FabG [Candidatus Celerinatantimonas neptuna]|nr:MAG: 3-oxoacyl-[acyl-carrier-protein] reductase FabG [Candidatus Celerinatantimonas neptuna]